MPPIRNLGTGVTLTCSGLSTSAVRFLYFGIKNNSIVNGDTMTGTAPAASSAAVFGSPTTTTNSITYTASTTVFDSITGTSDAVSTKLILTFQSGIGSLVATGGTPANNGNGAIGSLWRVNTGVTSFTVDVDVQASSADFPTFGSSSPTVFNPTHTRNGTDIDRAQVDLGFY